MISRVVRRLLGPAYLCLPVLAGAQTATVDFGTTFQTIRGFGGSESWMPQFPAAEANALFGTAAGSGQLGLSILRVRIDPSSTTGGSNWATELANAQEAAALGATIIATPWTPPAAWKSNNSLVEGVLNPSQLRRLRQLSEPLYRLPGQWRGEASMPSPCRTSRTRTSLTSPPSGPARRSIPG